ncbi:MAG: 23S rRNA (guanosine(2251)-2'-O)-methyltransferase RlmB [Helicobacteraceae bacterium]|jgi:23S rRNA (guanosine2251-2'-O)-methyltransferase|nr:23S rRNA (guanosine(2251)-2'-O)-methyltransferase RlmB [Helicobacteraceae bacterium]
MKNCDDHKKSMVIFGKRPVLYTIERHCDMIETIFVAKELDKKLFAQLKKARKPIEVLDFKKAQALARGQNHQGMLAKIKPLLFRDNRELYESRFVVMCAGITDAGNLGAIVRSAYALGVDSVVFSGVSSVNLETLIRVSSGAALDMPLFLTPNALETIELFKQKGFLTIGADVNGEDARAFKTDAQKTLLVLGAEGEGLSDRALKKLDRKIAIAMTREFDSLNVSAAAAILIDRIRT